jgi:putative flippase GtrA
MSNGKFRDKLMNGSGIFVLIRSTVSSQIASWIDLGLAFVLFAFAGFYPWLSTALGALAGGIVNCYINYKYTFHASDCNYKVVAVKYTMVWCGSLFLNSAGTELVYLLIKDWSWLRDYWHFTNDGCFAAARLSVSFIVSVFWNFLLQSQFVYVRNRFDHHAERLFNKMKIRKAAK